MAILVIVFLLWILDTQLFGYVMTDFLSIIKMGDIVFDNWDHIGSTTTLHSTIKGLIDWVNR